MRAILRSCLVPTAKDDDKNEDFEGDQFLDDIELERWCDYFEVWVEDMEEEMKEQLSGCETDTIPMWNRQKLSTLIRQKLEEEKEEGQSEEQGQGHVQGEENGQTNSCANLLLRNQFCEKLCDFWEQEAKVVRFDGCTTSDKFEEPKKKISDAVPIDQNEGKKGDGDGDGDGDEEKMVILVPEEGDDVWAILDEDEEWHEAVVVKQEEVLPDGESTSNDPDDIILSVKFKEWGFTRTLPFGEKVLLMEGDGEGEGDGKREIGPNNTQSAAHAEYGGDIEGTCEMCGAARNTLTFHHLVPKETHKGIISRGLGVEKSIQGIFEEWLRDSRTHEKYKAIDSPKEVKKALKVFLGSHGITICGRCHYMIHQVETNLVLARRFNTLEKLMAHPKIATFVKWASQ